MKKLNAIYKKNVYFACTFLRISYFPRKVHIPLTSHTARTYASVSVIQTLDSWTLYAELLI